MYVTFQIKPTPVVRYFLGERAKTEYYAIKCNDLNEAMETAADINSIDGVSYLRINKSGRLNKKVQVFNNKEEYYASNH